MTLEASIAHWSEHQVADLPLDITAEQSFAELYKRNAIYPSLEELMPTDHHGVVLDFGCGPGHDVVSFLYNGAEFVYAADVSLYALEMTQARVLAHGWGGRCKMHSLSTSKRLLPVVDHIHTAGVIHHVPDPVETLARLRKSLKPGAEIRMMVYSSESDFYNRIAGGDPATFAVLADGAAPITNAWTDEEVVAIAAEAGLDAEYVGSYLHPGEMTGPGLSSCWSLRP